MERTPVQPTRHWAFADYFQRTFENILILRRVLRPRRICDIYDFFQAVYKFTYLLTTDSSSRRTVGRQCTSIVPPST